MSRDMPVAAYAAGSRDQVAVSASIGQTPW